MTNSSHIPETDVAQAGRLAQLLVNNGVVSVPQIQAALALQENESSHLVKGLVSLGFLKETDLTNFLVKHLKLPRLNLGDYKLSQDIVKIVPRELCLRYRLIPIDVLGKNLTLAMVNPLDDAALAAIQQACPDFRLKPFLCSLSDFELVANRMLRSDEDTKGSGDISLQSLGITATSRKTEMPAPAPRQVAPPAENIDPTATKLFDGPTAAPRRSSGPLRSSLICLDGWELGREIEIQGSEYLLGRSADADTTISSPMISREHARITRNEEYGQETFVITDLKSSNGTFVNNVPVTTTILRHGDRILLGNVLFKFVLLDEVEARFHKDVHRLYSIQKGTGLLPADAWFKELDRALTDAAPGFRTASLIEIDNLASIEQSRGQIASVIVLSDASDLLGRCLGRGDLPGDLGNGRIGVLFEAEPMEGAYAVLEDLRRTVEAYVFTHKEDRFRTTISIGLATSEGCADGHAFFTKLKKGLGMAVEYGRNRVEIQH
jgi:GGDEF domain-containing protein